MCNICIVTPKAGCIHPEASTMRFMLMKETATRHVEDARSGVNDRRLSLNVQRPRCITTNVVSTAVVSGIVARILKRLLDRQSRIWNNGCTSLYNALNMFNMRL
ncbi:hypothetical protein EVAR_14728_1 [Eumeta japonica]|uniref:Uncharacterized protein n=1 Tax=Eumeta variegata TaxID=151549 RepID=A0A4C1TXH9_EUMVA|nr:hypothetical protein EVAR_14728_1 [Eumeta japonica]